ncbi:dispanin subfamily A member 2b [Xenopus laevis]|nr:dispanin subfamily A member 2b [Xenopus laevis]XP_041416819.1 dispanin subfamily A member 2b [Xenopus laevis]
MKSGGSPQPPAYDNQQETRDFMVLSPQTQSTVVNIQPTEEPQRDYLVWSIFNLVHFNFCCLGLLALVFSVKSRDRKQVRDTNGAKHYASTSRSLNIATTVLSILCFIIFFILFFTGIFAHRN